MRKKRQRHISAGAPDLTRSGGGDPDDRIVGPEVDVAVMQKVKVNDPLQPAEGLVIVPWQWVSSEGLALVMTRAVKPFSSR